MFVKNCKLLALSSALSLVFASQVLAMENDNNDEQNRKSARIQELRKKLEKEKKKGELLLKIQKEREKTRILLEKQEKSKKPGEEEKRKSDTPDFKGEDQILKSTSSSITEINSEELKKQERIQELPKKIDEEKKKAELLLKIQKEREKTRILLEKQEKSKKPGEKEKRKSDTPDFKGEDQILKITSSSITEINSEELKKQERIQELPKKLDEEKKKAELLLKILDEEKKKAELLLKIQEEKEKQLIAKRNIERSQKVDEIKRRLNGHNSMEIKFLDHQINHCKTIEQKEYHKNKKNNFIKNGFKSYDLLDKTEETENNKFYKEISEFFDEDLDKNFIKPLVSIVNILFPENDKLPNGIGFKLFEFINGNTPHQLEELSKLKPHLVLFLYENHSILTSYFKMEPQEGAQFLENEFLNKKKMELPKKEKMELLKKKLADEKEKTKVLLGKNLSKAITEGNIEKVKKLVTESIKQGVDLQNALDLALENKHDEVVKILLEAMQSRPTV